VKGDRRRDATAYNNWQKIVDVLKYTKFLDDCLNPRVACTQVSFRRLHALRWRNDRDKSTAENRTHPSNHFVRETGSVPPTHTTTPPKPKLLDQLRASLHFPETGYDIRTVQELLGHKDVKTTMIYTHVLNRGPAGVRSPMDGL
jgi:integrase